MDTKFAEIIKALRKEAGLSQAAVAKLVGVSQQCVSEWENKKNRTDVDVPLETGGYF